METVCSCILTVCSCIYSPCTTLDLLIALYPNFSLVRMYVFMSLICLDMICALVSFLSRTEGSKAEQIQFSYVFIQPGIVQMF